MIFRQLFDANSSTYTYLLGCADTRDAVVIDPVYEQHARDTALIRELDLKVRYVLDTHVHADHVTGAWLMRTALGAEIAPDVDVMKLSLPYVLEFLATPEPDVEPETAATGRISPASSAAPATG